MGKRIQDKPALILIIIGAAVCFIVFCLRGGHFSGRQNEIEKTIVCDLEGDGTDEIIKLADSRVTVERNGVILWESDEEWEVCDVLAADIDGDGSGEILVLLWKKGSYGEYLPFWEEENDEELSQHIFIYRTDGEGVKAVWMSSRLKPQVASWDMTEDNRIHIVTDKGEDTVWKWDRWGLVRVE
ncbi:MAG: hypothetical protein NC086_08995 [Alistipes sp.]|nr:hypothetical protein [Alistipes sp.]